MKKKAVRKRSGVIAARRLAPKPTQRRWLGVNESLGLYTRPNPKYVTSEAREEWPGLPLAVQRALICMNEEQDRDPNAIPGAIVAALLGCGEYFNCNLDARDGEE